MAPSKPSTPATDPAAIARLWQYRLGIEDWPAVYRTAPVDEPQIRVGTIDVITLPADSSNADVIHALLRYAFHETPAEHLAGADLKAAAHELATIRWEDE